MMSAPQTMQAGDRLGGFALALLLVVQLGLPVLLVYGALALSFGVVLPQLGALGAVAGFVGMFLLGARLTARGLRFLEGK